MHIPAFAFASQYNWENPTGGMHKNKHEEA